MSAFLRWARRLHAPRADIWAALLAGQFFGFAVAYQDLLLLIPVFVCWVAANSLAAPPATEKGAK